MHRMDLQKQINYWSESSKDDLITSELLINNNRLLHGLFWCHLTIEKALKAHVVKITQQIPPRTHNLLRLIEKTDLSPDDKTLKLLGDLMVYQLEGRYPERFPPAPSKTAAIQLLTKTNDLHKWLINKL